MMMFAHDDHQREPFDDLSDGGQSRKKVRATLADSSRVSWAIFSFSCYASAILTSFFPDCFSTST